MLPAAGPTGEAPDGLAGLGLSDEAAALYRALLADPGVTTAAPTALAELAAARLTDDGRPVDPRIGVPRLIRHRRDGLDAAALAVDGLSRLYLNARSGETPPAERISGREEMVVTLRALIDSAEREVCVLDTPPYAPTNTVEASEADSLGRGVRTRVIYAVEVLELARQYDSMKKMTSAGEDARVLAHVPFKLLLVDGERALLPFAEGDGPPDAAVLVHPGPLGHVIATLFETLWADAIPIADSETGDGLDPDERELLALLVSGLKDETIARRLDLSARTVSRRVNRLLDRLGAANRFQAGAQAVRRGWLRM